MAALLGEREADEVVRTKIRQAVEGDLRAVEDVDRDTGGDEVAPKRGDAALDCIGRRRPVPPYMRRRGDRRNPLGGGPASDLAAVFDRAGAVVDPGKDVGMEVDQIP